LPTREENRQIWQELYDWSSRGDEWSQVWGGEDMQWYAVLLPRIQTFVLDADGCPTRQTILEIAPGFGRWTKYLKNLCQKLILVDLAPKCIEACKQRFRSLSHIEYHVNDGKSLVAVPDDTVDFVFSMDSLVHADEEVIEAYLNQLAAKLRPNGVGFIHHSNFGEFVESVEKIPDHNRARTMTAEKFKSMAEAANLKCLSQELINWGTAELTDALSVFARKDADWNTSYRLLKNENFMGEAAYYKRLAALYGRQRVAAT
jgi:2-polyprenyl-3-methyl-5-hydroxy-6-metoxy-1,4-benzoquinol methylase